MAEAKSSHLSGLSQQEELSARWDKVTFSAQGSPLEDLSISCLAKNSAGRPWSRPSGKVRGDTLARYIYLSFEELQTVEQLDLKAATHLLEICEATLLFEQECSGLASFEELDTKATSQRMRFVEEYGLSHDYPIALSNLDPDFMELCQAEDVVTLIDLMGFIDHLTEKAWIGGSFKDLQNVFAHGDEKGLCAYFPYRMGHRGFHLPEALALCLKRLSPRDLRSIEEYHERRGQKSRFSKKQIELPKVVETRVLPEIFQCLSYFGQRQPKLLTRLHDSAYLSRELMFLKDPRTEDIIHWLLHLALGIFRPALHNNVGDELKKISVDTDTRLHRELKDLVEED